VIDLYNIDLHNLFIGLVSCSVYAGLRLETSPD